MPSLQPKLEERNFYETVTRQRGCVRIATWVLIQNALEGLHDSAHQGSFQFGQERPLFLRQWKKIQKLPRDLNSAQSVGGIVVVEIVGFNFCHLFQQIYCEPNIVRIRNNSDQFAMVGDGH